MLESTTATDPTECCIAAAVIVIVIGTVKSGIPTGAVIAAVTTTPFIALTALDNPA